MAKGLCFDEHIDRIVKCAVVMRVEENKKYLEYMVRFVKSDVKITMLVKIS